MKTKILLVFFIILLTVGVVSADTTDYEITIPGLGGSTVDNVPVMMNISDSNIATSFDNYSDVRFYQGGKELGYWMNPNLTVDGQYLVAWVNVSIINGTVTVDYNNASRTSTTSDIGDTFGSHLVHAYMFDEGSGDEVVDFVAGNNAHVVNDANFEFVDSPFGKAVNFDEANSEYAYLDSGYTQFSSYTVVAWSYVRGFNDGDLDKVSDWRLNNVVEFRADNNDGTALVYQYDGSSWVSDSVSSAGNTWKLLTARWDGSTLQFADNNTFSSGSSITGMTSDNNNITIGAKWDGSAQYYDGKLDMYLVYNSSKSNEKVYDLHNSSLAEYEVGEIVSPVDLDLSSPSNMTYYIFEDVWVNGSTVINANVSYSLDGGSYQNIANDTTSFNYQLTDLSVGEHTLNVKAYESGSTSNNDSEYREFNVTTWSKDNFTDSSKISVLTNLTRYGHVQLETSFQDHTVIDGSNAYIPDICEMPNGHLIAVYQYGTSNNGVGFRISDNTSSPYSSWGGETTLDSNADHPSCYVASNDRVFVAYEDGDYNHITYSDDNGSTWSTNDTGFHGPYGEPDLTEYNGELLMIWVSGSWQDGTDDYMKIMIANHTYPSDDFSSGTWENSKLLVDRDYWNDEDQGFFHYKDKLYMAYEIENKSYGPIGYWIGRLKQIEITDSLDSTNKIEVRRNDSHELDAGEGAGNLTFREIWRVFSTSAEYPPKTSGGYTEWARIIKSLDGAKTWENQTLTTLVDPDARIKAGINQLSDKHIIGFYGRKSDYSTHINHWKPDHNTGTLRSKILSARNWQTFYVKDYQKTNSTITYNALNASNNNVLVSDMSNGTDISSIPSTTDIKLEAEFSTTDDYFTPTLEWWKIQSELYTIINLQSGKHAVLESNRSVDVTQTGQSGLYIGVLVGNDQYSNYSAKMDVNFTSNVNFSGVTINTNREQAKSVLYGTSNISQVTNQTLLIPRIDNSGEIYICPNAESLGQVNQSCPNIRFLDTSYSNVTTSTIEGQNYYNVTGVVGTGGGEKVPACSDKGSDGVINSIITVGSELNCTNIQWAINNASSGMELNISAGNYAEDLTVDKNLDFVSSGKVSTGNLTINNGVTLFFKDGEYDFQEITKPQVYEIIWKSAEFITN